MRLLRSESVRRGAEERLLRTAQEQALTEDALRRHRPLEAEDNPERLLGYIQHLVGVDRSVAERIARYDDPRRLGLSPDKVSRAESLQGDTVDFLPVAFLDLALVTAESVARIAFKNRAPQGSAFLISPRLLLTNQHVIETADAATQFYAEFRFQQDHRLQSVPVTRFALAPETFYLSSPEVDLDYALVAVGARIDGPGELADFGFLALSDSPDKHALGAMANIIQHPDGRPKEIVIRENRILARTDNTLIYGADTLAGASGSVVLNDLLEPIALHHYGSPFRARKDPGASLVPALGNEGIRISAIVHHLAAALKSLTGSRAKLLEEALGAGFSGSSLVRASSIERHAFARLREPSSTGAAPQMSSDGTATWTVPFTFSVRMGSAPPAPPEIEAPRTTSLAPLGLDPQSAPTAEKVIFVPEEDYSTRRGYDDNFLGLKVALPKLSAAQKKIAAKNLEARAGDDPHEFKYQHFSVSMNASRRLAFFTAVNIDGASMVEFDRKTGDVTSGPEELGAEAREKWYEDPRIAKDEVAQDELYLHPEMSGFHRGHLVKRTDPSWGTQKRAFRGQSDTFHFTNCAPQWGTFNSGRKLWLGLEEWIGATSDDENFRVTVFSGPVFKSRDPKRATMKVPLEYWKIVVWNDDGELRATGMVANQKKLIPKLVRGGEAAEDLGTLPAKLSELNRQVSIAAIEDLTGLSFGKVKSYDTLGGAESKSAEGRPVERYEEIRIGRGARARR